MTGWIEVSGQELLDSGFGKYNLAKAHAKGWQKHFATLPR